MSLTSYRDLFINVYYEHTDNTQHSSIFYKTRRNQSPQKQLPLILLHRELTIPDSFGKESGDDYARQ